MAKKALGRGLEAVFGDVEVAYQKEWERQNHDIVQELDISQIKSNPYQPRVSFDETQLTELSNSIKKHGLLQPIIVMKKDENYMLIAGERRLRASKLAGFNTIKAIVADIESKNLRELALIENIQRQNLNPIELANAYKELISEHNITQDELSNIIHKSRVQITNTIRLLKLSKITQDNIINENITFGHGKVLVGLDEETEILVLNSIIGQKLSVRETENLIKKIKEEPRKQKTKRSVLDFNHIKEKLNKTRIKFKIKNNDILLQFKTQEDIEEFLNQIK